MNKITLYSNIIIYLVTIGLYTSAPVNGGLSQIALGIFQIVVALFMSIKITKENQSGYKYLQIYWYAVLACLISIVLFSFTTILDKYYLMLYIIPMTIGLYFLIVNYLIYKNQKS